MESEVRLSPDQKRIFTQLEWLLEQVGDAYADFIKAVPNSLPQVDSAFQRLKEFIEAVTNKMLKDSSFVPMEATMDFLNDKAQKLIDLMHREKDKQSSVK